MSKTAASTVGTRNPGRRIKTVHEFPPIPIRRYDWRAYFDGDEENAGNHGWGATEADAIDDLIENYEVPS